MFQRIKKNALLKNSFIIFAGSSAINLGNYFYYLFLGRKLGPEDFGVFASLISLLTLISIPGATIQIFSTKIAAKYGEKNQARLNYFIRSFFWYFLAISLLLTILLNLFSGYIARFLNINSRGLILTLSFSFLFFLFIPLLRGIVAGLHRFKFLSFSSALETVFKLLLGISLVIFGFKVYGAIIGIIASSFFSILLLIYYLKFIFIHPPKNHLKFKKQLFSLAPIFLASLIFNMFYTIDMILVKHYFPDKEAGLYGALAKIGMMIFFLGGFISAVLLPMISRKYENKENTLPLLGQAFLMVAILISGCLIIYYFFSGIIIKILFGSSYLVIQWGIFWMGLVMSALLLISILMNYFMAVHNFKFLYIFLIGIVLEFLMIIALHNSLEQVIIGLGTSFIVVLVGMLGILVRSIRKSKSPINH